MDVSSLPSELLTEILSHLTLPFLFPLALVAPFFRAVIDAKLRNLALSLVPEKLIGTRVSPGLLELLQDNATFDRFFGHPQVHFLPFCHLLPCHPF